MDTCKVRFSDKAPLQKTAEGFMGLEYSDEYKVVSFDTEFQYKRTKLVIEVLGSVDNKFLTSDYVSVDFSSIGKQEKHYLYGGAVQSMDVYVDYHSCITTTIVIYCDGMIHTVESTPPPALNIPEGALPEFQKIFDNFAAGIGDSTLTGGTWTPGSVLLPSAAKPSVSTQVPTQPQEHKGVIAPELMSKRMRDW